MAGKAVIKKINSREDIYKRLLENYKEWNVLMAALKKEERDLRRDFLRIADEAKIEKLMRRLQS